MAQNDSKWLDAPKSNKTVRVRMVDTTAKMLLHSISFIEPVMPDHETMNMTDVAFLIEHQELNKKAMFDLGVRKDFWNLPPKIRSRLGTIALGLRADKDVPEILMEKSIPLEDINDVIWSHGHWDHTGDPSLFPPTTNLVYGAAISKFKPGYPTNPDSPQLATNFSHRHNHEITFDSSSTAQLTIGGFRAHDFYDDGSFYLLETPGHAAGHMCGLARTSVDDEGRSTFILMGGDVCHFCGDLRPNETHSLPEEGGKFKDMITRHPQFSSATNTGDEKYSKQTPWYRVSTDKRSAYDDPGPEVAQKTVNNLIACFDVAENVLIALAHDTALLDVLPTLNDKPDEDLNAWYEKGWKAKAYWGWIGQLDTKEKIVEGFWKEGVRFETVEALLEDAGRKEMGTKL